MSTTSKPTGPTASPHMRFDDTLGALVIGGLLNALLTGVTSVQIYAYYGRSQRDPRAMKWTISILWVIDVVCLVLIAHAVYHYTVTNFTDPIELLHIPWSLATDMIVGPLCQVIVVSVYAYRIWKLSGKAWTLLLILPLAFCDFGGAIAMAVFIGKTPFYTDCAAKTTWLWSAIFAAWAVCDCIVAATLCTILIRQRTGFRKTESLIKMLVMYSISTGALTSSLAIASVLTVRSWPSLTFYVQEVIKCQHVMMPDNFIFMTLTINLPKFMLNSLLALLNSRQSMRDKISGTVSVHLSKLPIVPVPATEVVERRDPGWVVEISEKPSELDEGTRLDSEGWYGHDSL